MNFFNYLSIVVILNTNNASSLLKTLTNSTSFYTKIIDSIYVVSTSESIINAINPKENLSFETLNKTRALSDTIDLTTEIEQLTKLLR